MKSMKALVETVGLTKHFPIKKNQIVHAVDDVTLTVHEKEIVGLVGESGSGKSTLGKTLLGLHDKTAGQVIYDGETLPQKYAPTDFLNGAKKMQMIFQDPYSSLNPRMTVGEIIAEGLKLHTKLDEPTVRERVSYWLQRVGLHADHASRYPHEFSGGQRQRIGIARALILEPEFVVCDEPISALDVSVQAQVVNLLDELKKSMGLTLLFIAHDLSMVRYVSDRMAVMYLGSLVEVGAADDVFFNPQHPYTQMLVGSNPEPDPRTERDRPPTPVRGEITSPINIKPGCRFASRCTQVMDECKTNTPELITLKDTTQDTTKNTSVRQVACHLYS